MVPLVRQDLLKIDFLKQLTRTSTLEMQTITNSAEYNSENARIMNMVMLST